jgi:hypothetical protein
VSQILRGCKSVTLECGDVYRGPLVTTIATQALRHTPMGLYIEIKTEQRHEETHWHYADHTEPSSCGTAQGVMNGVGEVLTGMAVDARSVGSIFN